MYATSSAVAAWSSFTTDTTVLIALGVTAVLAALAALLGLGFAVRHVRKYITGRKF